MKKVTFFPKMKPEHDLKSEQLIRKGLEHRLSAAEIIELLTGIGYDSKKAEFLVKDYIKKREAIKQAVLVENVSPKIPPSKPKRTMGYKIGIALAYLIFSLE